MFWTVDVLGYKVDVFVVDVLEIDVLELDHLGRPKKIWRPKFKYFLYVFLQ